VQSRCVVVVSPSIGSGSPLQMAWLWADNRSNTRKPLESTLLNPMFRWRCIHESTCTNTRGCPVLMGLTNNFTSPETTPGRKQANTSAEMPQSNSKPNMRKLKHCEGNPDEQTNKKQTTTYFERREEKREEERGEKIKKRRRERKGERKPQHSQSQISFFHNIGEQHRYKITQQTQVVLEK